MQPITMTLPKSLQTKPVKPRKIDNATEANTQSPICQFGHKNPPQSQIGYPFTFQYPSSSLATMQSLPYTPLSPCPVPIPLPGHAPSDTPSDVLS